MVEFVPMQPEHAMAIQRQASQRVQLGLQRDMTIEEATALAEGGEAWAAIQGGNRQVIACIGLKETFPCVQAVAWAILSDGIGAAHLAVSRMARARIAASPYRRIEAIVRTDAECAWAKLLGLTPLCVLRKFGAASEDHVLYERVV